MSINLAGLKPEEVVKEAFWLAWKACRSPIGMGFLQDKKDATKEDVWNNAQSNGDCTCDPRNLKSGRVEGDYVFGRMMKLRLRYTADAVDFPNGTPRSDYQSWSRTYPSYEALIGAAISSLLAKED